MHSREITAGENTAIVCEAAKLEEQTWSWRLVIGIQGGAMHEGSIHSVSSQSMQLFVLTAPNVRCSQDVSTGFTAHIQCRNILASMLQSEQYILHTTTLIKRIASLVCEGGKTKYSSKSGTLS